MRPWLEGAKHSGQCRVFPKGQLSDVSVTITDGRRSGARGHPGDLSLYPRGHSGRVSLSGLGLWF